MTPEFQTKDRSHKATPRNTTKVLITFGGSDPRNNTLKVLKALSGFDGELDIKVIVGKANFNGKAISEFSRKMKKQVTIKNDVSSLCEEMITADIAFCSVGNTAYELAYLGVPGLLIIGKEDHRRNAELFDRYQVHKFLGLGSEISEEDILESFCDIASAPQIRKKMSQNGKNLIDGKGVSRIADEIDLLVKENVLSG